MNNRRGGLARRAHPFTLFAVTGGVAALAFILPAPFGPLALYAVVIALALIAGTPAAVSGAALLCLPLWAMLFLLHAVIGGGERIALGPLVVSRGGIEAAAAQAGRLGAIATASLALFRSFDPSRFLDAVARRGWSFHAAYLFVATLQAAPRLRERAATIVAAQRARGLRYGGGPLRRLRALVPLTLPLVLGMLSEVDERAMALEVRGLAAGVPRTPIAPPADHTADRIVRWAIPIVLALALAWRLTR
ncbi:MAG: energy-coupling factor transporter transmembrane component T [Gemmatimonadota bacterium]